MREKPTLSQQQREGAVALKEPFLFSEPIPGQRSISVVGPAGDNPGRLGMSILVQFRQHQRKHIAGRRLAHEDIQVAVVRQDV